MSFLKTVFICGLCILPTVPSADTFSLPAGAQLTKTRTLEEQRHFLPTGPWNLKTPTLELAGTATQTVYKLPITSGVRRTAGDLAEQFKQAGYELIFQCQDIACGGFDFRFDLKMLPPPAMYVDLSFYSFASLLKPNGEAAMIMVSQSHSDVFVHLTLIDPTDETATADMQTAPVAVTKQTSLAQSLENFGHFALEDLSFATGADALSDGDVPSLVELAEYLSANPHRTITLVGHTDSTGTAAANLALSQKRAGAVRSVLIDRYGVDADRIEAEGVGDLAPRASNSTDEGRRLNRRVEVIIRATE